MEDTMDLILEAERIINNYNLRRELENYVVKEEVSAPKKRCKKIKGWIFF